MQAPNGARTGSYGPAAKLFHWVTAALIAVQYLIMQTIPDGAAAAAPEHEWRWDLHASVGVLILLLTLARLANRVAHPPPPPPASMPRIQRIAAVLVHAALYLALIAMPVLGWLTLNAYSGAFAFFGLFDLPVLVGIDPALKAWFGGMHRGLAAIIVALLAVHVAAALFHAVIRRDGVMSSMIR